MVSVDVKHQVYRARSCPFRMTSEDNKKEINQMERGHFTTSNRHPLTFSADFEEALSICVFVCVCVCACE